MTENLVGDNSCAYSFTAIYRWQTRGIALEVETPDSYLCHLTRHCLFNPQRLWPKYNGEHSHISCTHGMPGMYNDKLSYLLSLNTYSRCTDSGETGIYSKKGIESAGLYIHGMLIIR